NTYAAGYRCTPWGGGVGPRDPATLLPSPRQPRAAADYQLPVRAAVGSRQLSTTMARTLRPAHELTLHPTSIKSRFSESASRYWEITPTLRPTPPSTRLQRSSRI